MRLSVVVRSRDEAPRLRLTLASLAGQADEVVVVDDGSVDATAAVIAAAGVRSVRHAAALGRSAAANAGAAAARGDVLLFLDGDTLAGPGLAGAHRAAHAGRPAAMARGETWHLRCTRFLADPERLVPWPDQVGRIAAMPAEEVARMGVTEAQVRHDFAAIARRAAPGIYPGAAPRRLHEAELAALRHTPDCPLLWAAASGSNFSVPRGDFLAAGGFDPALDINEHRELALRLMQRGLRLLPAEGARTYHMTHRSGWRDPLVERGWEAAFRRRHPAAPLAPLMAFWRGLADGTGPASLADLADRA
ncbi:glycosyltransferase family 2 protein [Sphingomonas profundi]|uniref:glycosyltransferase family 2 protein n=1 Tax=Alterirhizorhabdus profundi TaxID=2681549 RepID=UPI0018D142E5|nr:glycosyltransferase [Sphingomonas profundi]